MIVPDYWAEARKQHRSAGKQVTVRRFGWSTTSEADARAMAELRANEALQRILSGEKLDRRERKVAYNGAFGVPIREEVLSRHGEEAITRNAYGAHCLNTPRAVFADIDFSTALRARTVLSTFAVLAAASALAGLYFESWRVALALVFVSLFLAAPAAAGARRAAVALQGGQERIAHERIRAFLAKHPSWNIRVYRTPGGLRLLVTHQPFQASAAEVQQLFSAVGVDPVYVRMCNNQQCFRARLTAKPWRIGIGAHMRPRPGVWPVRPDKLHVRGRWVAEYERAAAAYAACRFVESLGSGVVHPEIRSVVALHDRESRATQLDLPIA